MILVDHLVWQEYLSSAPGMKVKELERLLMEEDIVTIRPVLTEVLAKAKTTRNRKLLAEALQALHRVDPNWNMVETWDGMEQLVALARRKGIRQTNLLDRMVIYAAKRAGAALWTLDRRTKTLASATGVNYI